MNALNETVGSFSQPEVGHLSQAPKIETHIQLLFYGPMLLQYLVEIEQNC